MFRVESGVNRYEASKIGTQRQLVHKPERAHAIVFHCIDLLSHDRGGGLYSPRPLLRAVTAY